MGFGAQRLRTRAARLVRSPDIAGVSEPPRRFSPPAGVEDASRGSLVLTAFTEIDELLLGVPTYLYTAIIRTGQAG